MNDPAVRLKGVTKVFNKHTAVSDFHLDIHRGVIHGLLGPNGSGKTTTIRMIMGILMPDSGSVELLGGEPDFAHRSRVGYLPEERGVYEKMKVIDQLVFLGEIRGVPRKEVRKRAEEWLDRLELSEWTTRKVEDLSKGMQQKVQFIATVLHQPELLILDEPFSGLDPINQDVLESIVREEKSRGTTILFSTHLMEQAERLCERVSLISRSKKVLDGDLKEIKRRERSGVVALEFEGENDTAETAADGRFLSWPGVSQVEKVGDAFHLSLREGASPDVLLSAVVSAEKSLKRFELLEPRLHEIFVRHAGGERADKEQKESLPHTQRARATL